MDYTRIKQNNDGSWAEPHLLQEHLTQTAELARGFAGKFNSAEWKYRLKGHTVLNPAKLPYSEKISYEACMRICLAMLAEADGIVLLKDWLDSNGAKREKAFAEERGIEVIYDVGT